MTIGSPRTWAAFEKVTAALMNAELRDQLVELFARTEFTPVVFASSTNGSTTSTSTSNADPQPAQGVFTAPPSGTVFITVDGVIENSQNGSPAFLGWQLREGGTIGSGTAILGSSTERALRTGAAVNTGGSAQAAASRRFLVSGLTPGAEYNVRTTLWVGSSGTAFCYYRHIIVEAAGRA